MILKIDRADPGGVSGTVTLHGMPSGGDTVAPLTGGRARYNSKLGHPVFTAQARGKDKATGETFYFKFNGYRQPFARRLYITVSYQVKFARPAPNQDGSWGEPCGGRVCGGFPMTCVVEPCQCGQITGLCWTPTNRAGTKFATTAYLRAPGSVDVQGKGVETRRFIKGADGQRLLVRRYTFSFPGSRGRLIYDAQPVPEYSSQIPLKKVQFTTYGTRFVAQPPDPSDFILWWSYYADCNCQGGAIAELDTTDYVRQLGLEFDSITPTPTLAP